MISYLGDFAEDDTVYIMFNTFSSDDPSASCTITNFVNTDVHIHKDDGLTQRNNAAGITVSVDFDGITGSHMVKIDTSDNTVAGFWVVGHEYFVRIEGTTIDGATINAVVGQFSIQNRYTRGTDSAALAATALTDVTWTDAKAAFLDHAISTVDTNVDTLLTRVTAAVALASVCTEGRLAELDGANIPTDVANIKAETALIVADTNELQTDWVNGGRLDLLLDAIPTTAMRGTDNAALAATALTDATWTDAKAVFLDHSIATVDTNVDTLLTRITAAVALASVCTETRLAELDAANLPTTTDNILEDTGTDGVLLAATATSAQLVDDICDEELTGVTHNVTGSLGRRIREIGAFAIHSGTAQAGASNSITLAATANGGDGIYNRNLIVITDNTGVGQTRTIVDYNNTTKVVVVDRDWRITPDNTTAYQIVPDNTPLTVDHGVAQGGTSTTITIRDYASSVDDVYLCNQIAIVAGTGRGQVRLVGAYNGTTKVVTICGANWVTTPDTTSIYVMMPYGTTCTNCIGTAALALINTECDTALTDYDPPTRTEATTDKNAIITEVDANETKIDALQTDSTAIKAKTDNLPSGIAKNVALPKFDIYMVLNSDHVTAATGKTITGQISKDGGAFAGITNVISEVGNGMYTIASGFTQTEMNADVITLKFTETDCDQRIITIYTS